MSESPLVTVWRFPISSPDSRGAGSRLLRRLRADHPRLRGSVSHSPTMGLVALAHGCAIGVDLEDETAGAEGDAVAGDMLSRSELEEYRRLPAGMRPRAFLRAWTAKEAVLKATGLGLALSPRTVSLRSLTAAVPELAEVPSLLGPAAGWRLSVLDAGPGRIATLAVIARAQPRLSYRDWSRSASRTARAMTVSVGLAKPAVGNAELPAT